MFWRGFGEIVLAQRLADRHALGGEERVGHAAADDQHIDLGDQIAEQIELGRHLGAADDGGHRALRRLQRLGERVELGLHGAARIGGQLMAEAFGRGMGAVRDRKGVVDPDVAERGKRGDEAGIVLLLAVVEAGVFETEDVAVLHRGDGGLGRRADAVVGKADARRRLASEHSGDGLERILRVAPLGAAEMREQDHLAALVGDFRDGRRHALDAGRVADLAVVHRHVEVDPQQHALAA